MKPLVRQSRTFSLSYLCNHGESSFSSEQEKESADCQPLIKAVEKSLLRTYDPGSSNSFYTLEQTMSELAPTQRDRNLGVLLHLSSFAGIIAPYAGFIVPVVIWLVYKESDFVNRQGFIFFNGLISYTIYGAISGVLCFILIGFPLLLVVLILAIWGPIRAALAAREGALREYPLVIKFLRTS
jgi:uncharacterized Tic20 family protein